MNNDGDEEKAEENLTDHSDDDMGDFVPRTLREFNVPREGDVRGAIRLPRIVGQQPNLNPGVVNIVQQNTFHRLDHEDPHAHLQTFLECCTTIKTNGATVDYIRLALFPFTLRDKAKKWQRSDEPLNEAWERFRKLQYSCPHHGIPDWLLIQTFYDGLTESTRTSIDVVAGGALMEREPHEAMNLIDNMVQNQQWSGRDNTRAGGGGRFEVDQITALTAKLDAM
ncbi:uncharacterized protein LOC144557070 [Carex rostrata]